MNAFNLVALSPSSDSLSEVENFYDEVNNIVKQVPSEEQRVLHLTYDKIEKIPVTNGEVDIFRIISSSESREMRSLLTSEFSDVHLDPVLPIYYYVNKKPCNISCHTGIVSGNQKKLKFIEPEEIMKKNLSDIYLIRDNDLLQVFKDTDEVYEKFIDTIRRKLLLVVIGEDRKDLDLDTKYKIWSYNYMYEFGKR